MTPVEERKAIETRLEEPEFVKDILQFASLLESDLDICLSNYFCAAGKHFAFVDLICPKLRFEGKVQVLEGVEMRTSIKSRLFALEGLRRIQKIRNLVAHPSLIPASRMKALQKDRVTVDMILGYPDALGDVFARARRGLYYLARSREWRHDASAPERRGAMEFFLEKWKKSIEEA